MPLELTQSRVQKIWVPVDHRPSLPRCECRQLHGGLGCRLRRVQSPAIVCAVALCRFPSAGSALVPAGGARRGWRRAASPRLGRRGAVTPETSSVCPAGPERTEASASQRLERPGCSGVSSGRLQQGRGHQHQRPFSLGFLGFTVSFFSPSLGSLCSFVSSHLHHHSRVCRFLVAGMVYGLVTSVVSETPSFIWNTEFASSFS